MAEVFECVCAQTLSCSRLHTACGMVIGEVTLILWVGCQAGHTI